MKIKNITNIFKNKKILITGNTGFKGSWLSLWMISIGAKVYGYSKNIPTRPSLYRSLNLEKHIILKATHPSPLGANKGGFFGCKHFSKVNEILKEKKLSEINW